MKKIFKEGLVFGGIWLINAIIIFYVNRLKPTSIISYDNHGNKTVTPIFQSNIRQDVLYSVQVALLPTIILFCIYFSIKWLFDYAKRATVR